MDKLESEIKSKAEVMQAAREENKHVERPKTPKEQNAIPIEEVKKENSEDLILLNGNIGSLIINFVDIETLLKLLLLNRSVYSYLTGWNALSKLMIRKITARYAQRANEIKSYFNQQKQKEEALNREFAVESDPDIPRIYQSYIKDPSRFPPRSYAQKALRNSRLFYLSREVYATKVETKGFLDSIFSSLVGKSAPEFVEIGSELKDSEMAELLELERSGNLELIFKGLQRSVKLRVDDQNEVNKWFYNLQLCFCENYIALASVLPSISVSLPVYIGLVQVDAIPLWEA